MTTRAHAFALDIIANAESGGGTQFAGTDVLELARAYVGMGWQPIESAPRDGTVILLHGPSETYPFPAIGQWHSIHKFWVDAYNPETDAFGQITHWQPLPSPPSEGRDE